MKGHTPFLKVLSITDAAIQKNLKGNIRNKESLAGWGDDFPYTQLSVFPL